MYTERIIKLLSNHRQPRRTELPQSLTLHTIATLIRHTHSPQQTEDLSTQLETDLRELQAQGEVLAGTGNRFCMAPPAVLAENKTNLTGLLFRGDRAYLKLAHESLETGQLSIKLTLHPKINGFHRIKERLQNCGIRLLTAANGVDHLPIPEFPRCFALKGFEWDNPFQTASSTGKICQYIPQPRQCQTDRWLVTTHTMLSEKSLIKLPTGEFLWFEANQFYEITPDAALLAMFRLDQLEFPLQVAWDETPGRLNLQGISLPSHYAQLLWRLSQPDPTQPRSRIFFNISNRPIAREALTRLGCTLV